MSNKKTRRRRAADRAAMPAPSTVITEQKRKSPGIMMLDALLNEYARTGTQDHLIGMNRYTATRLTANYALMDSLYRGDWIAHRIITTIPEDMIKNWFEFSGSIEPDLKAKFRAMERKTHIQRKVLEGLCMGRLYGGAAGIMVIKGQEDMLDQPIDYNLIMPGSFKGLIIADRWNGVYPSIELVSDLDDPDFGLPAYYVFGISDTEIEQGVRVHHSRVLRFIGSELPYIEKLAENYWGMSELERVFDELNKRNSTSANIAQLVFAAHLRVLKIEDLGQSLSMMDEQSQKDVYNTVRAQNELMNNFSLQLLSKDDDFQTFQYSFYGLADIYEQFMMDLSGAAKIPATKLFGRAPQGLNATGEGDLRNYYDTVRQGQERDLRPILEKLLPVMCMSAWGAIPDDLDFEFNPIRDTSDEERAALIQQTASAIIQAYQAALISQKIALQELRDIGVSYNMWKHITDEDIDQADDTMGSGEMLPELPPEIPPEMEEEALLEDGGPGSGNFGHPGYPRGGAGQQNVSTGKKAGISERARFIAHMMRPQEEESSRRASPQSHAQAEKNNRERQEWSELSLGQKVRGNTEQERHMGQVKREAYKAAVKGDFGKANAIMKQNKHYWSNDPDAAMKVQSETLKRQKRAKTSPMIRWISGLLNRREGG